MLKKKYFECKNTAECDTLPYHLSYLTLAHQPVSLTAFTQSSSSIKALIRFPSVINPPTRSILQVLTVSGNDVQGGSGSLNMRKTYPIPLNLF